VCVHAHYISKRTLRARVETGASSVPGGTVNQESCIGGPIKSPGVPVKCKCNVM
jgi:hypothetical protein